MSIHFKGKNGPMLIAEIGGNHEGDAVYARELTKLAIQSNVDVIKYQIYFFKTSFNLRMIFSLKNAFIFKIKLNI